MFMLCSRMNLVVVFMFLVIIFMFSVWYMLRMFCMIVWCIGLWFIVCIKVMFSLMMFGWNLVNRLRFE